MFDNIDKKLKVRKEPGFRFSIADACFIFTGILATILLWYYCRSIMFLCPMVICHFFLFCNVFRIGQKLEYIWSIIFVVNVLFWLNMAALEWYNIILTQSAITLTVIVIAIFRDDYHGVGYKLKGRKWTLGRNFCG